MKKLLALVAAGTLLAGCGLSVPGITSNGSSLFGAKHKLPAGAKKWTILMHVAADNNLYPFSLQDLNEMEAGLNPDDVNVVALYDGEKNGDSGVYVIKHDPNGKNDKLISTFNQNLPFIPASHEIDSGNPAILTAFGQWAIQNFPAEHYALGIWDHGSGLFRRGAQLPSGSNAGIFRLPYADGRVYKGFSWDDNGGHMDTKDLSTILPALAQTAGQPIDMLGFDACLMGHVEIGYQVKGFVNYLVGSEELEPGPGWDYVGWLKTVTGASTPAQVASSLVDAYAASYRPGGSQAGGRPQTATLAASDLNALSGKLVPAINGLAQAMTAALPADSQAILTVRNNTQSFYNSDCCDLGDFVKRLQASNVSAGVKQAAQGVQQALGETVIREGHVGNTVANATGLVIYFPVSQMQYNASYDDPKQIAFANEQWRTFLKAFDIK